MSDLVKTGIQLKIENECGLLSDESEWVNVSLLTEKIKERKAGLIDEYEPIEDDTFSYGAWEALKWIESLIQEDVSLCKNCNCMTKTIDGKCGKCKEEK